MYLNAGSSRGLFLSNFVRTFAKEPIKRRTFSIAKQRGGVMTITFMSIPSKPTITNSSLKLDTKTNLHKKNPAFSMFNKPVNNNAGKFSGRTDIWTSTNYFNSKYQAHATYISDCQVLSHQSSELFHHKLSNHFG